MLTNTFRDVCAGKKNELSAFECRPDRLKQGVALEWFHKKLNGAATHCLQSHLFVSMCRDENGGDRAQLGVQLGLQFQTRHSRHSNVGDEASGFPLLARLQEGLSGIEQSDGEICRFQQALHSKSIRLIVIDYGNDFA
jgi:hypothetical protein